jgi:hypothetical protein
MVAFLFERPHSHPHITDGIPDSRTSSINCYDRQSTSP